MSKLLLPLGLLLTACGGGGGAGSGSAAPLSTSPQVVTAFMKAAADSNLTRMGELWGTANGPASKSTDNEKRLAIMQAYVRGDSIRIVADEPVPGSDNRRKVTVALYRRGCLKQFPINTVLTKSGGWLVNSLDVTMAGNPARPCEGTTTPP